MHDKILNSIADMINFLQKTMEFIGWIDAKGVYLLESSKYEWILVTFSHMEQGGAYESPRIYSLPILKFSVLASGKPLNRNELELSYTKQNLMKHLEPKEWPLYITNSTTRLEEMIKAGKWVPKQPSSPFTPISHPNVYLRTI